MNKSFQHFLRCLSLSSFLVVFFINISAQQPLSLHKALEAMEQYHPSLQLKQSLIKAAEAYVKQLKDQRLPSLQLMEQFTGGTDNGLNGSYFPMGIVPSTSGGKRAANESELAMNNFLVSNLQWDFFNFGGYKANEAAASSLVETRKADLAQQDFYLRITATASYFSILKNQYLLKYSEDAAERLLGLQTAIKAYVVNGLKPGVDSSIANAELSKARLNILEAQKQLAIAKNELSLLTGIDTLLIRADTVNAPLMTQWPALSFTDASANHPLVQYYESVYKNNQAFEKAIEKSNLPKLSLLSAAWLRSSSIDPYDKFHTFQDPSFSNRYNYMAGVAMTYNLFEGKKRTDKLAVQQSETNAALQNLTLQKEQLESAGRQADINVRAALQKLDEIPIQLKAAADAYAQKLALYNSGLANIVDVVNAYYVLNRAETDEVLAKDEYWKAVLQKAYTSNQFNQLLSILK